MVVGHHALCGSSTVGTKFYKFPPQSISTGNQGGRPVQLRVLQGEPDSADALSHLPPAEKKMALAALKSHKNNFTWGMFNIFNIGMVCLIAPLPAFADLITLMIWMQIDKIEFFNTHPYGNALSWLLIIAITPPCNLLVQVVESFVFILYKWVFVGRYKEGNYPFYGPYHRKWIVMMAVKEAIGKLLGEIAGTIFTTWFFRAMGSKIGKDACIFGYGLEYDLFSAGDYSTVGVKCDVTCHTVENMVIKLAPTRIENQTTMHAGALVQPGGVMKTGSVILENSQLLKGGQAEENSVYRGLPAEPVQRTRRDLDGQQEPIPAKRERGPSKPVGRMSIAHKLFLLVVLASLGWFALNSSASTPKQLPGPVIVTMEGSIRGLRTSRHVVFQGIPYAQPPVGQLRWQPPMPVNPWRDTIDTRAKREPCMGVSGTGSEDCLYLDVIVPADAFSGGTQRFPVVYWLPGGCFAEGYVPGYDGRSITGDSLSDALIVTASHRVGPLGFLPRGGNNTATNFGLLDQRAVLEWISRNIEVLHGDPNKVTLFGQGSAAASVAAHLVMARSWGLFQGAIMQSASTAQLVARHLPPAVAEWRMVAKALGCEGDAAEVSRCLHAAQAQSISTVRLDRSHGSSCGGSVLSHDACQWGPVVDGVELLDQPWRLIQEGRTLSAAVMMGWRVTDGARGMDHAKNSSAHQNDQHDPGTVMDSGLERDGSAQYIKTPTIPWYATGNARTDQLHGCLANRLIVALQKYRKSTARYLFLSDGSANSHIWFQRGVAKDDRVGLTPYMLGFLNNFDPNSMKPPHYPSWPVFNAAEGGTHQLMHVPQSGSVQPAVETSSLKDTCQLWDKHWAKVAECEREEHMPVGRDPVPGHST